MLVFLWMAPLDVFILTPSDAVHLILFCREKAKIIPWNSEVFPISMASF